MRYFEKREKREAGVQLSLRHYIVTRGSVVVFVVFVTFLNPSRQVLLKCLEIVHYRIHTFKEQRIPFMLSLNNPEIKPFSQEWAYT
jgi:hypothetical protein